MNDPQFLGAKKCFYYILRVTNDPSFLAMVDNKKKNSSTSKGKKSNTFKHLYFQNFCNTIKINVIPHINNVV